MPLLRESFFCKEKLKGDIVFGKSLCLILFCSLMGAVPATQPSSKPTTQPTKMNLLKGLDVKKASLQGKWIRQGKKIGVTSPGGHASDRTIILYKGKSKEFPSKYCLEFDLIPKGIDFVGFGIIYGKDTERTITSGFNIYYQDIEIGEKRIRDKTPIGKSIKVRIEIDKKEMNFFIKDELKISTTVNKTNYCLEDNFLINAFKKDEVTITIRTRTTLIVNSAVLVLFPENP